MGIYTPQHRRTSSEAAHEGATWLPDETSARCAALVSGLVSVFHKFITWKDQKLRMVPDRVDGEYTLLNTYIK